jgi:hypothetical protein
MEVTKPNEFIGFGAMGVTKPYKFIGFGATEVTKPYEFIGFGAIDVTKPYEFIRFGAMDVTKPYEFIGFGPPGEDVSVPGPSRAPGRAGVWAHGPSGRCIEHILLLEADVSPGGYTYYRLE